MYDNIGDKIKGLAKVIAWLGIIGSVIYGIALMVQGGDMMGYGGGALVGAGFVVIIVGAIASWASSLVMYGFGELVEKATVIAAKLPSASGAAAPAPSIPAPTQSPAAEIDPVCPKCGHDNAAGSQFCKVCGAKLSLSPPPEPVKTERRCPKCNEAYSKSDDFCSNCGAPLKEVVVIRITPDNGLVICPKCGGRQRSDRTTCFKCGARFEYV
ncbi:MAG: zinc ribbon domain-containing protein [Oscillospiraceae bacterium]|jgi:hypothetical protein|nr:zinc ribbon domain-containing protein [Oscillospiraceae bacterium]